MRAGNDTFALVWARSRLSPPRRLAAWLVTGPLGHLAAGVIDWIALLVHWASARARGRDPWG